jgi:hypothetical protein
MLLPHPVVFNPSLTLNPGYILKSVPSNIIKSSRFRPAVKSLQTPAMQGRI